MEVHKLDKIKDTGAGLPLAKCNDELWSSGIIFLSSRLLGHDDSPQEQLSGSNVRAFWMRRLEVFWW